MTTRKTTRKTTKRPQAQDLGARIGQFVKAVPEWVAAGSLRARAEAALEAEYQRGGMANLSDRATRRLAEWDNRLAATKSEVLAPGEALAAELEAQGIDPLPLRELLAHVERDEYETVDQTWPHVKAWLQGAGARLRAGRPVGNRAEGNDTPKLPAAERDEIITGAVAVQDFCVTARTLQSYVHNNKLKDHRPPDKRGTTSPLLLSRKELSQHFTQRKN